MNNDWKNPTEKMLDDFDEDKLQYMVSFPERPNVKLISFSVVYKSKEFCVTMVLTNKMLLEQKSDLKALIGQRISQVKENIKRYKESIDNLKS